MKILVACEFSGTVREAFRKRGHDAWSCDLMESEIPGNHLKGDVLRFLSDGWDLMVAHPPCTHLSASGARHWAAKKKSGVQDKALEFVRALMDAPIKKIAIENPVSIISTAIRKPDQIIQPWMFGHGEVKTTCLWLENLPPLKPTQIHEGREQRCWRMSPSKNRWLERSRTFQGIADAMADQWSKPPVVNE